MARILCRFTIIQHVVGRLRFRIPLPPELLSLVAIASLYHTYLYL
jgi:hypothetical protein